MEQIVEPKFNLSTWVDKACQFYVDKFKENGWVQEDLTYVYKKTDFTEYPVGVVFYAKLLEYYEDGKNVITPWITGRLEVETTDDLKLKAYKSFILEELDQMGLHAFHDEDAFYGHFTKKVNKGWTELNFYLHPFYPDGYWENHTL